MKYINVTQHVNNVLTRYNISMHVLQLHPCVTATPLLLSNKIQLNPNYIALKNFHKKLNNCQQFAF